MNDQLKKANVEKIRKLFADLKEEEEQDEACRVAYGGAFKMEPSTKANEAHKKKLTDLTSKINQASAIDQGNVDLFLKSAPKLAFIKCKT